MSKNNGSKKTDEIKILNTEKVDKATEVFGKIESQHGEGSKLVREYLNELGVDIDKAREVRADLYLICRNGNFSIAKSTVKNVCSDWFKDKGYSNPDNDNSNNGADNKVDAERIEELAEEAKAETVGMTEAEAMATAIGLQVKGKLLAEFTDNPRQKWATRASSVLRALSRNKTLQANLVAGAGTEPEPKGEAETAEVAEAEACKRMEAALEKIEATQKAIEKPKRKSRSRKKATA